MTATTQTQMIESRQATSPRKLQALPRRVPEAAAEVAVSTESGSLSDSSRDAALVRSALEGDQAAFAELVERYQRKGFWIAYHTIGRVEDARDVVQDAFLRVYRSLHKFDFQRNFYTWFYRIVMNLAIDALRKGKSARTAVVEDLNDRFMAPAFGECSMVRSETRGLVWKVLERMDAKFKSVLVLRDIHGMSCREIAPILKVTHATVRWRLHRGRKLFRERWERLERKWG